MLFHGKIRVCVKYFDHDWGCAPCIYLCLINLLIAIYYFCDTFSLEQVRKDCVLTTGFGLAHSRKCLKILWYSLFSCNMYERIIRPHESLLRQSRSCYGIFIVRVKCWEPWLLFRWHYNFLIVFEFRIISLLLLKLINTEIELGFLWLGSNRKIYRNFTQQWYIVTKM